MPAQALRMFLGSLLQSAFRAKIVAYRIQSKAQNAMCAAKIRAKQAA